MLEAAATLAGFPKNSLDKREVIFGASGKNSAGGSVRLEFYCKDKAGHAAFRATIEGDYGEREVAESATVCVDFDPAALDKFLVELQQVETEHRGSASMINGRSLFLERGLRQVHLAPRRANAMAPYLGNYDA